MNWMLSNSVAAISSGDRFRRFCFVLGCVFLILASSRSTLAQSTGSDPLPTAYAWVHPTNGTPVVNPSGPGPDLTYINDPSQKFRSLQNAIDTMQYYLMGMYHPINNPHQQGIIFALPGVYGEKSQDTLPIVMRDRVHVQGVGARRCVLRGSSRLTQPVSNRTVAWPTSPSAPVSSFSAEVLLTYESATVDRLGQLLNSTMPWWAQSTPRLHDDDVPEVFDGFTFQGGDVQVLLTDMVSQAEYFPAARISNCVFDLRHGLSPHTNENELPAQPLAGPYFGIMMRRHATYESNYPPLGHRVGYLDGRTLIAHNTFVFARWNNDSATEGWQSESRASTVGIIDFTGPACTIIGDPDPRLRGVGNPCIVSNIFRTRPVSGTPSVRPFAMLGVGDEDTRVFSSATSSYVQTNAFDPARVGATNGTFWSLPVTSFVVSVPQANNTHWNCQVTLFAGGCTGGVPSPCIGSAPPQSPAQHVWDGTNGVDPAFVGEYVSTVLASNNNNLDGYVDWRIMPGSPMENLGVTPIPQSPVGFETAPHAGDPSWRFPTWFPRECNLFAWDGEHWGNPRISDGAPDIGFDERGLVIAAGNWANDSNSHNQPGFMHPTGVGSATRYFILPTIAGGVNLTSSNKYLRFHDTTIAPIAPNAGDGWVNPPGSLVSPTSLASLPVGYRTKYLSFATIPWAPISLATAVANPWFPLGSATGQPSLVFLVASRVDDECDTTPCKHAYFNLQGVIMEDPSWPTATAEILRGNMQAEYR